jgi:hypothetical protein
MICICHGGMDGIGVDDDFRNALALNHPLFIPPPDLALRLEAAFNSGSPAPPSDNKTSTSSSKELVNRRTRSTHLDDASVADAAAAVNVRTNVVLFMRAWVEMAYADVAILRRDSSPKVKGFLKTLLEDEDKSDAVATAIAPPAASRHPTAASIFNQPASSNGNSGISGISNTMSGMSSMSSLTGTAASSKFTMVSPPSLMVIDNAAETLSDERLRLRAVTRYAEDIDAKKSANKTLVTLETWLDSYYSSIVTDGSRLPKEQSSPLPSPPSTPTSTTKPSISMTPLGISRQLPGISAAIVDEQLFSAKPSSIAAQMTLCDIAILATLTPREFIRKEWTRKDTCGVRAANILAMVELFNRRSYWSACSVMMTDDSLLRPRILASLIEVAHELKRYNNFFGCYSVLTGISMSPLLRLKDLFSSLPSSSRKRYKELTHSMDQSKNFALYRRMFATVMEPAQPSPRPAIPHLAVILKDLFQVNYHFR